MLKTLAQVPNPKIAGSFFRQAVTGAGVARHVCCVPLVVEREAPRAGRALKLYRTAAERFLIPFELMHCETLEAMSDKLDRYGEQELPRELATQTS